MRGFCSRCDRQAGGAFRPRLWQCPKCVRPDTLILGENKPINEIGAGAKCIGLSGLSAVTATFGRKFAGELLRVKGSGVEAFEVTPEHPILVASLAAKNIHALHLRNRNLLDENLVWKPASYLIPKTANSLVGDYLVIPRIRGTFEETEVDIMRYTTARGRWVCAVKRLPTSFPINPDTAWLLGLYVAEGCSGKGVMFCIGKKETSLASRICNIASGIGYRAKGQEFRTARIVEISSRILSRAFPGWCGRRASNKRIPDFVLFHKRLDVLQAFLAGYMKGDGWASDRAEGATTVSRLLAAQLQLAYARVGSFYSIRREPWSGLQRIGGRVVHIRDRYRLEHAVGGGRKKMERHMVFPQYILVPVREIERVPYNGEVFNVETKDGTYIVSNVVVHNCRLVLCDACASGRKVGVIFKKPVCPDCLLELVQGGLRVWK